MNASTLNRLNVLVAAMGLVLSTGALAGNTSTQDVDYEVPAVNEIAITDGSPSLTVDSATAGSDLDDATVTTGSSWAVTTNETGKKLTAAIDTAMPEGLTLSISAAAPTGGSSTGYAALSTTAADIVTGITEVAESSLNLSYKLEADLTAGVVTSASKTITFTLTDGS